MRNTTGFIKLNRSFTEWEWYDDIPVKVLFLHLLLKVNHTETKYKGELVRAGECITGLKELSNETGLSLQEVRTALKKLEKSQDINTRSNTRGTRVEVRSYKDHVDSSNKEQHASNKQATNEQHTSNTPATNEQQLNNNDNNEKNENNENKLYTSLGENWNDVFPPGSLSKTDFEKNRIKVLKNNLSMDYLGQWFGRPQGTRWSVLEAEALMMLSPTKEEVKIMKEYRETPNDYHRKSLLSLLNNWNGDMDKARATVREIVKPKLDMTNVF